MRRQVTGWDEKDKVHLVFPNQLFLVTARRTPWQGSRTDRPKKSSPVPERTDQRIPGRMTGKGLRSMIGQNVHMYLTLELPGPKSCPRVQVHRLCRAWTSW